MRKTKLSILCDSPESTALAKLIERSDRNGGRESEWWGHPTFDVMPDGTVLVRLPVNVRNIALLHEYGATANHADPETMSRLAFFRTPTAAFTSDLPLKPFQIEGGARLIAHNLCTILAFDAGLGKTLTSLAVLLSNPEKYLPAIVLAPAHVKLNWGDPDTGEWVKWGGKPEDCAVLFGRTPDLAEITGRKLIVLNHHILAGWEQALISIAPKTLLVDEAHDFVNSDTKTYPIVERLARACEGRVLLLTATPLVNDLGDMWGLCNLMNPDILGGKGVFNDTFRPEERAKAKMFASRWRGNFANNGWKEVGRAKLPKALKARRIDELQNLLHRTVMLRKRKSEVLDQLPAITETHLRLDIPRTTKEGIAFWDIEDRCVFDMDDGKEDILASEKVLAAFGKAKRNAAFAKLPDAEAWIRNFLLESEDAEKLVVVGWSVEPLERLHEAFKKQSVLVNGEVEAKQKFVLGKRFAEDPAKRVLFGNYKSIGTGIDTLVVARTMLIFELPQTDVALVQVKGRLDRLSQVSNALSYYYMTIRGSIEEKRGWQIIRRKQKLTTAMNL